MIYLYIDKKRDFTLAKISLRKLNRSYNPAAELVSELELDASLRKHFKESYCYFVSVCGFKFYRDAAGKESDWFILKDEQVDCFRKSGLNKFKDFYN